MEAELAEKISKDIKINYLKIYILIYEYFRFIKGRAMAGAYVNFLYFFIIVPINELRLSKIICKYVRDDAYNKVNNHVIEVALHRAAYLRKNKTYNTTGRNYKRTYPLDYNPEAFWRTPTAMETSKHLADMYKKFKDSIYVVVTLNTQDEVEMYEYIGHVYKTLFELPSIKSRLEMSGIKVKPFKLKVRYAKNLRTK